MSNFAFIELVAKFAECVDDNGEESPRTKRYCDHFNGDDTVSPDAFGSLPQDHQDLLTRVCGFTPPQQ